MANALKATVYGNASNGSIPPLTDEELREVLDGLTCSTARKRLIETVLSLVGKVPYFWAGKSSAGWNDSWNQPTTVSASGSLSSGSTRPYGLACSGFTDWVYKTSGHDTIGRSSTDQWNNSSAITESELLPGDLGFKGAPGDAGVNHVLMYVGMNTSGKRLWVHCSSSAGGVVLNMPTYVKYFRRVNGVNLGS